MPADGNYEVGYKKPPANTRFKKGQCPNPKGRPRGVKNFSTLLRQAVRAQLIVIENGRRRQMTKIEAAAQQLANRMAQGDFKVAQYVVEKTEESERSIDTSAEPSSVSKDLDDARDEIRGLLLTVRDRLLQTQPGRTNDVGDGPGGGDGSGEAGN